jgi:hypothetical protein
MTLRLNGDSSGFTEIKAADAAGDNSIKLPASNGSANQLLKNGSTAGELEYTSSVFVDSSGRLLVNTSNSLPADSQLQVEGTGYYEGSASLRRNSNDAGGTALRICKSRGTSNGSFNVVSDGDTLGLVQFIGADGTNDETACEIRGEIDGTPGSSVMPGKLTFSTNAGGASVTPRVEIGSNGALKLLAGCPGIDFSAIQTNNAGMTSEMLDSYEEGSFSPTIKDWNGSYTTQIGTYIKIGKMVFCQGEVMTNGSTGSSMNLFPGVDGLPFALGTDITGGSGNISQRHHGTGTIVGQNVSVPSGEMAFVTFDNAGGASLFPNNISNTQAKNFVANYISLTSNFGYRFNLSYYTNA